MQEAGDQGKTFGYDNELLIANGIDPSMLHELPEELRVEILSSIEVPNLAPRREEEKKDDQLAAQRQQQPAYYAEALELGLDPEFLANLPEEMRNELIQNARQQIMPPSRQAEQMDIASFIATVTEPGLRREIFMNMDEPTIATLPPMLMAEARRVQSHVLIDRQRARDVLQMDRARGLVQQMHNGADIDGRLDALGGIYGQRVRGRDQQ